MRKKKIKKIKKTLPGHQVKPAKKIARVLQKLLSEEKKFKKKPL